MELQALIENYLKLLERENGRLRADNARLESDNSGLTKAHEIASKETKSLLEKAQDAITMRDTILWRLAIWDPTSGRGSEVHVALRAAIEKGFGYNNMGQIVSLLHNSLMDDIEETP